MNYSPRLEKIRKLLQKEKLDAILVSSVSTIIYLTGFSNFSTEEREAYLVITKKDSYILTDTRYSEAVEKEVSHMKLLIRTPSTPQKKLLKKLVGKESLRTLG